MDDTFTGEVTIALGFPIDRVRTEKISKHVRNGCFSGLGNEEGQNRLAGWCVALDDHVRKAILAPSNFSLRASVLRELVYT